MKNKKTTLEDLARMVQGGFSDMDKRFDGIDKRLDNLDERVLNLELRVASIEGTLNEHTDILTRHSEELRWIHKKIDDMTNPQSSQRVITQKEFAELEKHVSALEKKAVIK